MGIATKVFTEELATALDRVPLITLNLPTSAALNLADGSPSVIRFDRDLKISAIALDGTIRDWLSRTFGDKYCLFKSHIPHFAFHYNF
jgi:hypothetical protein